MIDFEKSIGRKKGKDNFKKKLANIKVVKSKETDASPTVTTGGSIVKSPAKFEDMFKSMQKEKEYQESKEQEFIDNEIAESDLADLENEEKKKKDREEYLSMFGE